MSKWDLVCSSCLLLSSNTSRQSKPIWIYLPKVISICFVKIWFLCDLTGLAKNLILAAVWMWPLVELHVVLESLPPLSLKLFIHNKSSQPNISEFICDGTLRSDDVWADWQKIRPRRRVHITDQVASGVKMKAGMCGGPSWPLPSIGQLLGSVWALIGFMSHLNGLAGVFFFSFFFFFHF